MEKGIICTVAFDASHHCHITWMAPHRDDQAQRLVLRPSSIFPCASRVSSQREMLVLFLLRSLRENSGFHWKPKCRKSLWIWALRNMLKFVGVFCCCCCYGENNMFVHRNALPCAPEHIYNYFFFAAILKKCTWLQDLNISYHSMHKKNTKCIVGFVKAHKNVCSENTKIMESIH